MSFFHTLLASGLYSEILYIVPSQTIIVPEGTTFGSIGLPSTVEIFTVDEVFVTKSVSWSSAGYDGNTPGFYVLEGTPLGIVDNLGVKAHIEVVVSHLTNEAVYYDFNKLAEADGVAITTLTDECGNFNASAIGSPLADELFDNNADYVGVKTFRDAGLTGFNMGTSGDNSFADQNFIDIYFVINSADGQQTNGIQIFGGRTSDTNVTFQIFITSTGVLTVTWGYGSGNRFTWIVNNYLPNGEFNTYFCRVVLDFTNDVVEVYRNQRLMSGSYSLSTIVGKTASSYNNTANMYVGVVNADGTPAGDTTSNNFFHKFAISNTIRTKDQAFEIEKEFIKGMYRSWTNEFHTSPGNVTAKRNAFIDYIFNGNGLPASTNFEDRTLTYAGTTMHEVVIANLVGDGQITRLRHDVTDNDGWTWSYYSYYIRNSGTWNGKLFIDHKGHGSEGPTTHENMINDLLADGFNVWLVAMPKGDNTNTDNFIEVGHPYTRGHEDLFNEGLDDGVGPYSPLHLFYEATIRGLNHILSDTANYGTITDIYSVGLSGGGQSVTMLGAMDTRITRTYCDRGVSPTTWKQYPFLTSTQNNDYEQNPANGFDTNTGPRNFAFHTENTVMDAILLCCTGGRRFFHLSHTEDPTISLGGYGNIAWTHAMEKKAIEIGGTYGIFLNTVTNQEAHLYQAAERAAIIADLP